MNLYHAHNQWSQRPPDERFSNLVEMYQVTKAYAAIAKEEHMPFHSLRVAAEGQDLFLTSKVAPPMLMTHHAFGQLCARVNAPADHYRELPPTIAMSALNWILANRTPSKQAAILYHKNGHFIARGIVTELYSRVWNYEVIERLLGLQAEGWRVPPARPAFEGQPGSRIATEADVIAGGVSSIQVGDWIAPAGLYASDRDMFAILINPSNRIDDGTDEGLSRGVIFWNGEVGNRSLGRLLFDFRHICGNHIIWDAKNVTEISVRHVGQVHEAFGSWEVELKRYLEQGSLEREQQIKAARVKVIGKTKEQVLDALFKLRPGVSHKQLDTAYDMAEAYESIDGPPNTVWGFTQGLTRLSQAENYADARTAMERATAKILQLVN